MACAAVKYIYVTNSLNVIELQVLNYFTYMIHSRVGSKYNNMPNDHT